MKSKGDDGKLQVGFAKLSGLHGLLVWGVDAEKKTPVCAVGIDGCNERIRSSARDLGILLAGFLGESQVIFLDDHLDGSLFLESALEDFLCQGVFEMPFHRSTHGACP